MLHHQHFISIFFGFFFFFKNIELIKKEIIIIIIIIIIRRRRKRKNVLKFLKMVLLTMSVAKIYRPRGCLQYTLRKNLKRKENLTDARKMNVSFLFLFFFQLFLFFSSTKNITDNDVQATNAQSQSGVAVQIIDAH